MVKYFQEKFALSLQGAKNLKTAVIWRSILNISFVLPTSIAFVFLDEHIKILLDKTNQTYGMFFYIFVGVLFFVIMYAISYIDYQKLYAEIYNESANRRIKLAETLRKLPLSFFAKKDSVDLGSTIMEDTTQIEQIFSHSIPQIYASIVSMSVMAIMLFIYNPLMSLALFWVVPVGFLVSYLSRKTMSKTHQKIYKIKRNLSTTIQDGIEMIQEIRSYGLEDNYLSKLSNDLSTYERTLINSELFVGVLLAISHSILKLGLPSVIFAGAYFVSKGEVSVFTYLVFLILVGRVYDPFSETMNNFAVLLYLKPRIDRMKEMDNMRLQEGTSKFEPKNYDINFENVNFSYNQNLQTIKNVNFTAKQGEITALIGASGSGKSTIAKLTTRFWDIDSGKISIGGLDISKIDPETLLKSFSIVFQDVTLFNTSILENIRLGRKNAGDEEVKQVAKLAQCDEFVKKLPQKYDTLIGENGEKLSGGQRQRISIARALLKNAPIILLDEATASLDAGNETKIQKAIGELVKNKTVIIIAHRMRTIMNADKIIAIENGEVKETGSPNELLKQNGIFASMVSLQAAKS